MTMSEEANQIVYGDREQTYGDPGANLRRIATLWSVIFGVPVTVDQVCLAMVQLKIARELHKPSRDNIVDSHGYLMLMERVRESDANVKGADV